MRGFFYQLNWRTVNIQMQLQIFFVPMRVIRGVIDNSGVSSLQKGSGRVNREFGNWNFAFHKQGKWVESGKKNKFGLGLFNTSIWEFPFAHWNKEFDYFSARYWDHHPFSSSSNKPDNLSLWWLPFAPGTGEQRLCWVASIGSSFFSSWLTETVSYSKTVTDFF